MNLRDCYIEEDLFPKIFTDYEEREYGILFFKRANAEDTEILAALAIQMWTGHLCGRRTHRICYLGSA